MSDPNFSVRSSETEVMDDLNCAGDVLERTLIELEFINQWLGGNAVTINALTTLLKDIPKDRTIHIADLGCGSGEMLRIIHRWADKQGRKVKLTGIDANPNIIRYAEKNLSDIPSASLKPMDIFSPAFRQMNFDIVIGTLFFHHFSSSDLVNFFSNLKKSVMLGIIINDIHRHPLAYHSIKWLTSIFSKSSMVKHDAPLSVMRAFSRSDVTDILSHAGLNDFRIQWKWAFRWQVVIYLNRTKE
jgi:2-polyprenyl-3-methyl-5-hydroxy-6-metoxy-1,4-benzoquinol methylase